MQEALKLSEKACTTEQEKVAQKEPEAQPQHKASINAALLALRGPGQEAPQAQQTQQAQQKAQPAQSMQ